MINEHVGLSLMHTNECVEGLTNWTSSVKVKLLLAQFHLVSEM